MATTLRYGAENLASFPDNTAKLISPEDERDALVSNRTGGGLVSSTVAFTAPMDDGAATAINPLIGGPSSSSGLWKFDANNRAYPDYAGEISGLTVPPGYQKFVVVEYQMAVDKIAGGTDSYQFQVDNNGVPVGSGAVHSLTGVPTYFALTARFVGALDSGMLIGMTVTPQGTNDDIRFDKFSMFVMDFQLWSVPA